MQIERNESFINLCQIEGRTHEEIQFEILQTGIETGLFNESPEYIGKTILQCLEQDNGSADIIKFLKMFDCIDSVINLIFCKIIE